MPRITNLTLLKKPEQHILSIRQKCRYKDLPVLVGENYDLLVRHIRDLGEYPSDIISATYYTYDFSADLDVAFYLPVAEPLPGAGDIRADVIPPRLYAFCMFQGPYSEMPPVFGQLDAFIAQCGRRRAGPHEECYYTGPEFLARDWLTRIHIPVI